MYCKSTRRSATFRFVFGLAALTLAACSGKLALRYGETLCDSSHPCPAGYMCADSICVTDTTPDNDVDNGDEPFQGDWDGTNADVDSTTTLCRTDSDCGSNQSCLDGVCLINPCAGVQCEEGNSCSYTCVPTSTACDNVKCADNLEKCVEGSCVPSCATDACAQSPQCDTATDANCEAGTCRADTLCVSGRCIEPTTDCGPNGDSFCDAGFLCSIGCSAPSLCDTISCATGFSCNITTADDGTQTPDCYPGECATVTCPDGQTCISGDCTDQCAYIACADGGRLCDNPDSVCCNGECCASGEICRVIDESKPGVCLAPSGVCDPACSDDEICVEGVCLCAEYPDPKACGAGECCRTKTCGNPCEGNPCSTNSDNPLCSVDCTQTDGYKCVNGCGGVDCTSTRANTACDPENGSCYCGHEGDVCTGSSCCVANPDTSDTDGYFCDNPCSPNPCTEGDNTKCTIDCTKSNGYSCSNPCTGKDCSSQPNQVCNTQSGNCECGSTGAGCAADGSHCCVGGTSCKTPCSPNPCGDAECRVDCTTSTGYTCVNHCTTGQCSSNAQNPDCNPATGNCTCHDSSGNYPACGTNQCCVSGTGCTNPCSPNPCTTGTATKCTVVCSTTGADYQCSDPCTGNNCATANTGRDPDCRSNPSNTAAAQCWCSDAGAVCGSGKCCDRDGNTCTSPCSPNQCPTDSGDSDNGKSGWTQCIVDCTSGGTNDYYCKNPCDSKTCYQNNPNCHSDPSNQNNAQCWCAAANAQCSGSTCCLASGCVDPCANNADCGSTATCVRDCSQTDGYSCSTKCPTGHCSSATAPTCDPNTGNCSCNGSTCASAECCIGGTTCDDPCSPDPCGSTGVCVRDCTKSAGYTCNNACGTDTCNNQNPDCDPSQSDASKRCTCNLTDICTGSECCVSDACNDVCGSGDPCTSGTNTKCTTNCNQTGGYSCSNPCSGNSCSGNNPQCRSSGTKGDSSQCYCSADASAGHDGLCTTGECCTGSGCDDPCSPDECSNDEGKCSAACTTSSGYTCTPQACSSSCGGSTTTCNKKEGACYCGSTPLGTTCEDPAVHVDNNGKQVCCSSGSSVACKGAVCSSCTRTAGTGTCTCDPCTGCTASGEAGTTCQNN